MDAFPRNRDVWNVQWLCEYAPIGGQAKKLAESRSVHVAQSQRTFVRVEAVASRVVALSHDRNLRSGWRSHQKQEDQPLRGRKAESTHHGLLHFAMDLGKSMGTR